MNESNTYKNKECLLMDLIVGEEHYDFTASISSALQHSQFELQQIDETISAIAKVKPECDKVDYALAASSGALCGLIDIFLVGKPGESSTGNITDKWFVNRTKDFAKLCGWNGEGEKSAIGFLEREFKVPYDQTGMGGAGSSVFELNPANHHFKSLAHNPTLCGLFFSILNQFNNTSHFVTCGEVISLQKADENFELRGSDVPSKLFCGIANWVGHLISDASGSYSSQGRGMGIPSPFWAWTNSVIAAKKSMQISTSKFNDDINKLALDIYKNGYDARFQAAQAIPVFINELITRLIYSIRRLCKYYKETDKEDRSFKAAWEMCEPFSNATVKRMLTVAHGTFFLLDIGDATVQGFVKGAGAFNSAEFFLRLNIIGVGRFAISLYGEGKRAVNYRKAERETDYLKKKKKIIEDYTDGLKILAEKYDDENLLSFVNDLKQSDLYITAFSKSVHLAELRGVTEEKILRSKSDIDEYFKRR